MNSARFYRIPPALAWAIALFPPAGALTIGLMLANPATERHAVSLLAENHMVENLTFAGYLVGFLVGARLAVRGWRRGVNRLAVVAVALFALASLVGAGEEVSWGQQFLHFKTPEAMAKINIQDETTIHNIGWLQDVDAWYPLALGALGMAAILFHTRRHRETRGVPSLLFSGCLTIALLSGYDNFTSWYPVNLRFDTIIARLNEYSEMVIGFASAIGLWLVTRRWDGAARAETPHRS